MGEFLWYMGEFFAEDFKKHINAKISDFTIAGLLMKKNLDKNILGSIFLRKLLCVFLVLQAVLVFFLREPYCKSALKLCFVLQIFKHLFR